MKKTLLLLLLTLLSSTAISAQSFSYTYEGQTLNYSVISSIAKTCEVVSSKDGYSGDIIIPEIVSYNNDDFTVIKIGYRAFYSSEVTSITMPESITEIRRDAFSYCKGLTSITIPDSVTEIWDHAFSDCSGLMSITLPNSITVISSNVFSYCKGLMSIKIPDSVTKIGDYAFSGCSELKSITLPNSLTEIGVGAFMGCTGLTSLTIPESVVSIGNVAFYNCNGLTTVTIPKSVTELGRVPFRYCLNLVSIEVDPENKNFKSYDGVLFTKDMTTLLQFPLGKGGSYIIPEGVTNIGQIAFEGDKNLTSISIPESIESIGSQAFIYCNSLTEVKYWAETPITAKGTGVDDIFYHSDAYTNATLRVPKGTLAAYKATEPWKQFKTIIDDLETSGIEEVVADAIDYAEPYAIYNLNGVKVGDNIDGLAAGIYIVRQGKSVDKIVVR